jgi:Fur family ferric uptake transcriptional regulator
VSASPDESVVTGWLADAALYRRLGLTPTPGRLHLLRYLTARDRLISAQDLHHDLRMAGTPVGLAAIYRALHVLAHAGELHTFVLHGETTYRRCSRTPHHHLVCNSCHRVWEEDPAPVHAWVDDVTARWGGSVLECHADILVICDVCDAPAGHRRSATGAPRPQP